MVWDICLSSVRPYMECKHFLQCKHFFYYFFYEYFSFSLTWDTIGAKISKRYSSYKSQPKAFKFFLHFLPNGPHKSTFGIFKILKIEIVMIFFFSFSLRWNSMGVKISKRYSSYKSQPKAFKLFLNILPNGPHKTNFGIFEILSFRFLTIFCSRKFQIHY